MTAVLESEARDRIRGKAAELRDLISGDVTGGGDGHRDSAAAVSRYIRGLEDAVLDLANLAPAGVEDFEIRQLLAFCVKLRRACESGTDADEFRLALIQMRDVVMRLDRGLEHAALDDERQAATFVFEHLSELAASELASILGVSTKTIGKWKAGGPVERNATRVKLVAQLLGYLRPSFTQTGFMLWLDSPAGQLGGKTPNQVMAEDPAAAWQPLISYARSARGQLAS